MAQCFNHRCFEEHEWQSPVPLPVAELFWAMFEFFRG